MNDLIIYNTLSRKKEKFEPITPGMVGIYVCGPTVYGHAHLGHAKSYISFDVVVRYMRHIGFKVRYVQNITDVGHLVGDVDEGEDKIQKQARLEKIEPMEVVESYTRSYFEDMDRLGLLRPDISPRASGHIVEQIDMIKVLLEKGNAYEVNGNVYFSVESFPGYGKLSGRKIDEMEAGVRVNVQEDKRHPADFALWKAADDEHLMRWNSPWGKGYPGWHIECSVMSCKYLGETFDIHGGGLENSFPHHECEIAQSEAANGKHFVRYWMHNNMVTVDGVKMGKSLGNFITLKDAFGKYNPLAIRFFILGSHYRSALDFSDAALEAAGKGYKRLQSGYARLVHALEKSDAAAAGKLPAADTYDSAFHAAMNDDFNTPQAIAAMFDFLTELNKALDDNSAKPAKAELERARRLLQETAGTVLGILDESAGPASADRLPDLMNVVLDIRAQVRGKKDYQMSDYIRDSLKSIGISIKDTPNGAEWNMD
jgi:cysteinyl-tRNA synthetase